MEKVHGWFLSIGLDRYAAKFEEEGRDTLEILCDMTPDEIDRCIDKPGHRRKFVNGLIEKPPTAKEPDMDKARPNDTYKTTKDVLQDSTKSLEFTKGMLLNIPHLAMLALLYASKYTYKSDCR